MLIDNINLNHIRIFESVYRTKSMTKAAKELFMTQSGVSQHIKVLEEFLSVQLFDRIKQRLIPTNEAQRLYEKCTVGLNTIEEALNSITINEDMLNGVITMGMPEDFGNNILIPLLANFGKLNQKINYKIKLGHSLDLIHEMQKGNLDFVFIDHYPVDRYIKTIPVYHEYWYLCASNEYLENKGMNKSLSEKENDLKKLLESLDFIDYQKNAFVLNSWIKFHYPKINANLKTNIRTDLESVQSVSKFIIHGLGAGIIPNHHYEKLQKSGVHLKIIKEKSHQLKNTIHLAIHEKKSQTLCVQTILEYLIRELKLIN